ncbi:DUF721 domain-containing protein [Rhabdothermincola sp.]|mgnify:CR=1 FL=1|uniref:DUF721 domain-containing protein n=1 Tax=Rhabdothermincola sp. TaxID=2820405 RepID=UPI002FE38E52
MSWRPLPTSDGNDSQPERLAHSLDRVVRHLGGSSAGAVGGLFGSWEQIVGERVARHATPSALRDGVLVVAVDDPAWATQLRFLEREILGRVQEVLNLPELARLEVRVRRSRG